MNINTIYNTIKSKGGRLTKTRKAIVDILFQSACLMSPAEITAKLKTQKIQPNRSTMYRELMFLAQNGIITKSTISQNDYFELPIDHHHHLICTGCNTIKKVVLSKHLRQQEKQLEKENEFQITNHSVEFYGLCKNCRTEQKV